MTRFKVRLIVLLSFVVTIAHALEPGNPTGNGIFTTEANFPSQSDPVPVALPPIQTFNYPPPQQQQFYQPIDTIPTYFYDPHQPVVSQPYAEEPFTARQRKDDNPFKDFKLDLFHIRDNLAKLAEGQRNFVDSLRPDSKQKQQEKPASNDRGTNNSSPVPPPEPPAQLPPEEMNINNRGNQDMFRFPYYSPSTQNKPNYYSQPAPVYPSSYQHNRPNPPYGVQPPNYSHQSHYQQHSHRPQKQSPPQKKKKKAPQKSHKNTKKIMEQKRKEMRKLIAIRRGPSRAQQPRPQPSNYEMQQHAQQSLMYIKRGLVDAFWTALIVFVVKLLPLLFYGLKLLFRSVIPLAGMAVYHNRRGMFAQQQQQQQQANRRFEPNRRGFPIAQQSNAVDDDQEIVVEHDDVSSDDEAAVDKPDEGENDPERNDEEIIEENNEEFDNDVDIDDEASN